jgi:hypothetical protein
MGMIITIIMIGENKNNNTGLKSNTTLSDSQYRTMCMGDHVIGNAP